MKVDGAVLKKLSHGELSSTIEKLQYVGKLSAEQIWDAIKDDIETLSVKCDTAIRRSGKVTWKRDVEVVASLPVRWFLSGGFKVTVGLFNGPSRRGTLSEDKKLRRALSRDMIELRFPVEKSALQNVDYFVVELRHPQYPSAMTFASASPYVDMTPAKMIGLSLPGKFAADRLCEDLSLYEARICGKEFRRAFAGSGAVALGSNVSDSKWEMEFSKVFKNIKKVGIGENPVGVKYVKAVEIKDGDLIVKYENNGEQPIKPKVSVFLLSKYGSIISRVDDVWRFKNIAPGGNDKSTTFKLPAFEGVKYIDVETE